MKRTIPILFVTACLAVTAASCTRTERNLTTGAATGALVGGVVTGNLRGAAAGALIGGVAGVLIGKADRPGRCYYRDRNGRRFIDRC